MSLEYQMIVLQQLYHKSIRSFFRSSCVIRVSDDCVAAVVLFRVSDDCVEAIVSEYQIIKVQQLYH